MLQGSIDVHKPYFNLAETRLTKRALEEAFSEKYSSVTSIVNMVQTAVSNDPLLYFPEASNVNLNIKAEPIMKKYGSYSCRHRGDKAVQGTGHQISKRIQGVFCTGKCRTKKYGGNPPICL